MTKTELSKVCRAQKLVENVITAKSGYAQADFARDAKKNTAALTAT